MEETSGSATLVAAPEIEAHSMTATVPRAEVEEVVRAEDGPIELYLDLLRPGDGETRTVRVDWDRNDLERILEESSGAEVTLAFDQRQLEEAFEGADVEGHGIRERALVLSVAVATAAAGASAVQAAPVGGHGGSSAAAAQTAAAPSGERGGPSVAAEAADTAGPAGERGGPSVAAETGAGGDVAGYQRAMPTDYARASEDVAGYQRAMPTDYGVTSGAVGAAGEDSPAEVTGGAAGDEVGGAVAAAGGEAPAAVTGAAGQPEFVPGVTDFPTYPAQPPQLADEGTGASIPEPARDAAIAGGIALLITAAGFALRGQRRRVERPA